MQELKLSNSPLVAIVDDEDFERCSIFSWCITGENVGSGNGGTTIRANINGKIVTLSHFVMKYNSKFDHKDRNPLNNQKLNLRPCTNQQNARNKIKSQNDVFSSEYKGVSWDKNNKLWQAYIRLNGKLKFLGRFDDEIKAAKAYNNAAIKYFGEFACLNCIKS